MKNAMMLACLLMLAGCATMPPMPGQRVSVGDRALHLYCSGPESTSPTVIIEGGLSGISPFYARIQQALEPQVRTCTYDRAGFGWSDPSDSPRDAQHIATELRMLLQGANVKPPYVLAGHSLGGLIAMRYQHEFPQEVAGLVFVDSSYRGQYWDEKRLMKPYKLGKISAAVGFTYLYNPMRVWLEPLPAKQQEDLLYFSRQADFYRTTMAEIEDLNESSAQAAETKTLNSLPVVAITAGKKCKNGPKTTDEQRLKCAKSADEWTKHHAKLAGLSVRGRHIVFPDATHLSLVTEGDYAEKVAASIMSVVEEARKQVDE